MSRSVLIAYGVIKQAVAEDDKALLQIVHHYARYITKLSMRTSQNMTGYVSYHADEVMIKQLETHLMAGILKFRIPPH
ncbi:helix-turn-helix domain-containing protein [Pseudolactococcus yaeyamensis]